MALLPMTWAAMSDVVRSWLGLSPVYIKAAGKPGDKMALLTSPDALSGYVCMYV